MPRSTIWGSRALLLAGLATAMATGAVLSRTHHVLSQSFVKALQDTRGSELTFSPSRPASGDEGYWLTRAEVQSPAPFAKPLAVGDRITISGADGRERRLEVIDLKAVSASKHDDKSTLSLLLVTCRVADEQGIAQETAPVRFIVEGELAKPQPATPKSL